MLVLASWSAWRKADPLGNLQPLNAGESLGWDARMIFAFGLGVPLFTPRSVAGAAAILIGGPANIFDAVDLWRHRLPHGYTRRARHLLGECGSGLNIDDIPDHGP